MTRAVLVLEYEIPDDAPADYLTTSVRVVLDHLRETSPRKPLPLAHLAIAEVADRVIDLFKAAP